MLSKITAAVGKALAEYELIAPEDRILVALSGGKDSIVLLHMLKQFQKKGKHVFRLKAFYLDQGLGPEIQDELRKICSEIDVQFIYEKRNFPYIFKNIAKKGRGYCSICGRLRRGMLYEAASKHGCNKLALGHHREDILTTFLLNLFFAGKMATTIPRYCSSRGITVIRPLVRVKEEWIINFIRQKNITVPEKKCAWEENVNRHQLKELLNRLEHNHPGLKNSLFAALANVDTRHLYDKKLYDFNLKETL